MQTTVAPKPHKEDTYQTTTISECIMPEETISTKSADVSTIRSGIDSEEGYVFVTVEDPGEVAVAPPPSGDDDDQEKSTSLKQSLHFCTEYKLCGGYCSRGMYVPGLDDGSNRETRMLEFLSDISSKLLDLKLLE